MLFTIINLLFLVANYFLILIFYSLIAWVILSWITLFTNKRLAINNLLDEIINPLVKPFQWARIGMIDLSPIVLIYVIQILQSTLLPLLKGFIFSLL